MSDGESPDEQQGDGYSSSAIRELISEAERLHQEINLLIEADTFGSVSEMNILENQLVPKTEEILSLLLKMAHRVETFKEPETEDLKHSAIVAINDILNIVLEFEDFFHTDESAKEWSEQISSLRSNLNREVNLDDAFGMDPFYGLDGASKLRTLRYNGSMFGVSLPPAEIFLELLTSEALVFLRGMLQCLFQYQITDAYSYPEGFIGGEISVENIGDFANLLLDRSSVLTMESFEVKENESDRINNMLSQLNFVLVSVADVIQNLKVGKGRYTPTLSEVNSHAIVNEYKPHRPYQNLEMWPAKRKRYSSLRELDIKNWLGMEYHSERVQTSVEGHRIVYRDFLDFIQGLGFEHKKVTAYDDNKRVEPQLTTFEWGGVKRKYREHASIYFYNKHCPISHRELRLSVDSDNERERITINIGVESFRFDAEHDDLPEDATLMKMRDLVETYSTSLLEQFVEHQKEHGLLKNAKFNAYTQELKLKGRTFDDLIISPAKKELIDDNIFALLRHAEVITRRGVDTNRGIMLAGPPGVGKSLTVDAIVNEANCTVLYADFNMLHKIMDEIFIIARKYAPTILILEDIDALGITGQRGMFGSGAGLSNLLNNMDGITSNNGVITVATSNHPEQLDWALIARPGRFDVRMDYSYPDHELLHGILALKLKTYPTAGRLDLDKIVKRMPLGFTGSHIQDIVNQSNYIAINQAKGDIEEAKISQAHLETAFERGLYNFNKFLSERPHVKLTGTPNANEVLKRSHDAGDHQFG